MSNKKPNLQTGETSGSGGNSTMVPTDRLSSLPDELLHHIMSFLRAWEVARTCVLSHRWRHLWASVPCVDVRVRQLNHHQRPPNQLSSFVYHFLLEREVSAPLHTLRLISSPVIELVPWEYDGHLYSSTEVDIWIRAAIKHGVQVIQLSMHPMAQEIPRFRHVNLISCHLKHVKLSGFLLCDRTLKQLSYQCPSLEVLDLKKCCLRGNGISSMSLKRLAIIECRIMENLIIDTPNLVSLCCITPHHLAPLFENLGSIAMGTIVLDDSFLYVGYAYEYEDKNDNAAYGGSDSDSDSSVGDDMDFLTDADVDSDASTCEYSEVVNDGHKQHSDCAVGCKHGLYHGYHNYHSNHTVDGSKILGGHNVIHSLANATSLKLLADAGEMILNRELKTCPIFINLKTLSLGEWSMADDFSPLIFFLQHTPNLERLFLELKLDCGCRKTMKDTVRPEGRSFGCAHLKMVKIKCCKQDARVHLLAQLFRAYGVPVEKIHVCRSTCNFEA